MTEGCAEMVYSAEERKEADKREREIINKACSNQPGIIFKLSGSTHI